MQPKDVILNRRDFDEWQRDHLAELHTDVGASAVSAARQAEVDRALERSYPKTRDQAAAELQFRGMAELPGWLFDFWASHRRLRTIHGVEVWYPSDVDSFIRHLIEQCKPEDVLSGSALRRMRRRMTWLEEADQNTETLDDLGIL